MRVLLLRIGALGAMIVLGWIAIANAQAAATLPPRILRNCRRTPIPCVPQLRHRHPRRLPYVPRLRRRYHPRRRRQRQPRFRWRRRRQSSRPRGGRCPIRFLLRIAAMRRPTSGAPPVTLPSNSIPDASVVGLAAPPAGAATSRYREVATPASAEQPVAGPALVSGGPNRSSGGRDASPPDRTASRAAPRYGAAAESWSRPR